MSKGTRNIILGVCAIIIVFVIISIIYQQYKTEPINANETKQNTITDANREENNTFNQSSENEETTNKENNELENTSTENTVTEDDQNNDDKTPNYDDLITEKENKAIDLVKKLWKKDYGNLDGVSFNVSIQNDGKYGVTVYDVVTTKTIKFYIVDVDTEMIRER